MKMRRFIPISAIMLGALLSACAAVGPDYKKPSLAVPSHWSHHADSVKQDSAALNRWWLSFHDPLLNALINEAITANLDLKQAVLRVKEARILRSQTIAAGLPSLNAKSTISKRLNNSSQTSGSGSSSTGGGGFGIGNQIINVFQSGFDAQWELDFFGGIRRAVEAADATVDSEVENSRMVVVTLLSEVARNVIELRTNQQLIALTQATLATQGNMLELTEIQQGSGLSNALAVVQAQAQVATTEAQLPPYQSAVEQAIHALSVLLGKEPNALAGRLLTQPTQQTPLVPASVAISDLPAELLKRRPDIRRAERQLALSTAYIGVATADLYPKVNLAAFIGLQNMRLSDFSPVGKSWSSSASVTVPLFNWGKLKAVVKSKQNQNEQALLSYQATVLTAVQEVEDALVAYRAAQQRQRALNQAVAANELALHLVSTRYQIGLSDFIEVLSAQTVLYSSQRERLDNANKQNNSLIALYKALGGGWQQQASVNDDSRANSLSNKLFKP